MPLLSPRRGVGAAEPLSDRAGHRPVEVAAEGANRQRRRLASLDSPVTRRLQLLLRGQQLAGQLRVQVATLIDLANQRVARVRTRSISRRARTACALRAASFACRSVTVWRDPFSSSSRR